MNRDLRREALEDIRQKHGGILRPCDVVKDAADPDSPLHSVFEWDDTKAAHQYRLDQARDLITVYVEVLPGERKDPVQVYVSMRDDRKEIGGGYRLIHDVLADPEARAKFLAEALAEFRRAEVKYSRLMELAGVFAAVKAVETKAQRKAKKAV